MSTILDNVTGSDCRPPRRKTRRTPIICLAVLWALFATNTALGAETDEDLERVAAAYRTATALKVYFYRVDRDDSYRNLNSMLGQLQEYRNQPSRFAYTQAICKDVDCALLDNALATGQTSLVENTLKYGISRASRKIDISNYSLALFEDDLTFTPTRLASLGGDRVPDQKYTHVDVFYATNRQPAKGSQSDQLMSSEVDSTLHFGRFAAAFPLTHSSVPSTLFRNPFTVRDAADTLALVAADKYSGLPEFVSKVEQALKRDSKSTVNVFVHGFKNSFLTSMRTVSLLAMNATPDGLTIAFCWPSADSLTRDGYFSDRQSAESSSPQFAAVLESLLASDQIAQVNVLAHSMGSVVAIRGIVYAFPDLEPSKRSKLKNIVLAAADFDRLEFREKPLKRLNESKTLVTSYASARDQALAYSAGLWSGGPRIGSATPQMFIGPGVDSIDATSVDDGFPWHSYVSTSRVVINDIYQLLSNSLPPQRRNLRTRESRGGNYWTFP